VTASANRAASLIGLAEDQFGLVTRDQLRAAGVTPGVIAAQVAAARWRVVGHRTVSLTTGPLGREAVRWLAVLEGGDECVLAGLSALHAGGLDGFPTERVHVAVPLGSKTCRTDDFVRRQCRRLVAGAVLPAGSPPRLRVDVALIDALEQIGNRRLGAALVAAVVQQRLLRPGDVRPLIDAERTLPGRRLYVAVAGDIEGGAHSLLEIDFGRLARRAGIPAPRGQTKRRDRAGRVRYLDADFGSFTVEVDGAVHLQPQSWWQDMQRQNDLVIRGRPILRFPSVAIRLQRDQVAEQLRAAARRWPPSAVRK